MTESALPSSSNNSKNSDSSSNFWQCWADTFYGVITAPITTFDRLADPDDDQNKTGLPGAFLCVLIGMGLTAFIRYNPHDQSTLLNVASFLFGGMTNWLFLSYVLVLASAVLNRRIKFKTALTVTGWGLLPFIFFPPTGLFKHVKIVFFLLATLPAFWLLFLQWQAFKSSLKLSAPKLIALIIIVPPILFFVYTFWIGLAISILVLEFLV